MAYSPFYLHSGCMVPSVLDYSSSSSEDSDEPQPGPYCITPRLSRSRLRRPPRFSRTGEPYPELVETIVATEDGTTISSTAEPVIPESEPEPNTSMEQEGVAVVTDAAEEAPEAPVAESTAPPARNLPPLRYYTMKQRIFSYGLIVVIMLTAAVMLIYPPIKHFLIDRAHENDTIGKKDGLGGSRAASEVSPADLHCGCNLLTCLIISIMGFFF